MVPPKLLNKIVSLFFIPLPINIQLEGIHLHGFTEYTQYKTMFWAKPHFRKEGSWYDYGLVAWEESTDYEDSSDNDSMQEELEIPVCTDTKEKTKKVSLIPAKIVAFIQD